MQAIWQRFTLFERMLLVAAAVAALAAVGDLGRGDGKASLVLAVIVACACVGAAGGSRKRRLLGRRRPLGPFEQLERSHPAAVLAGSGAVLGLLFAMTNGALIGVVYAGLWIGLQLAELR